MFVKINGPQKNAKNCDKAIVIENCKETCDLCNGVIVSAIPRERLDVMKKENVNA